MINITKKTSTTNTTYLANRSIKYIVIHYTAGVTSKAGTAASTASYFSNASVKASADFIVDDGTIVQFNPDIANRYAWHCGGSKYATKGGSLYGVATLKNTIGIEICSTNKTKKMTYANDPNYYFTEAVLNNAADLVKYLMDKYNIDVNHVIRHYDVNGK
jgi:N-acetylmuramoyl-L-alanine amidase CwlA